MSDDAGNGGTEAAILIVDTRWDSFGEVYEATEDLGVQLYWALNAEEAREMMRRIAIDIVVVSPEVRSDDGQCFYEWVRSNNTASRVYLIALLPEENLGRQIKLLEEGVDDFLVAPVDPFLLRARIVVARRMQFLLKERQRLEHNEAYLATVVTVAHKINNPLCAILGNAVLLRDELMAAGGGALDSSVAECLDTIELQAERIAVFLRQLQDSKHPSLTNYLGDVQMVDLPEE